MYFPDIIKDSLQTSHCSGRHAAWVLMRRDLWTAADAAVACIRKQTVTLPVYRIKSGRNRCIFRICPPPQCGIPPVIIKAFPMADFRQQLYRYRRYGPTETANMLRAAQRNIPLPQVYGYGWIRRCGLVAATIIMMEDLHRHRSLAEVLGRGDFDPAARAAVLQRVARLLLSLYHGGCNHIDLHGESVFFSRSGDDDRIIDFHYAAFHDRPIPEVLMFHAAYLGSALAGVFSERMLEMWVREMIAELALRDVDRLFARYRFFRTHRLSRRERLAIR